MEQDPILNEIRKIRLDIDAEYQNDFQKYYERLQQIQKKYSDRLICFKPKPVLKIAKTGKTHING
jgi:hypothetical protein